MAGKVIHFEIPIDDNERGLLRCTAGCSAGASSGGVQSSTGTTTAGQGDGIGGALTKRSDEVRSLMFYIDVDDIDDALAAVEAAGGTRLTGRMPTPTVGWSAFFEDTEGNEGRLVQTDPTVPVARRRYPGLIHSECGSSRRAMGPRRSDWCDLGPCPTVGAGASVWVGVDPTARPRYRRHRPTALRRSAAAWADQGLRGRPRCVRPRSRRPARRDVRVHRPQRGGEVHDDPVADGSHPAGPRAAASILGLDSRATASRSSAGSGTCRAS